MPYVPVPKDLTKVKTKLAFNLTKRQLICFSLAGLVGLPVYFFTRGAIGNSAAVLLMIGLMMPFFFFAMYERDGQPAEKILKNRLRYKLWPKNRPYRTDNLYKSIRTYRYKAFYSLDRDEGIEREILQKPLNPAEVWEQRQMTELIYKGLSKLPVKQRQRIYAHFFLGMSKADIAKAEGTHKSRITRSIEAGLRSLEKYFKEIL